MTMCSSLRIRVVSTNLKGYEVPELSRQSKGIPVVNAIELANDESISTMIAVND